CLYVERRHFEVAVIPQGSLDEILKYGVAQKCAPSQVCRDTPCQGVRVSLTLGPGVGDGAVRLLVGRRQGAALQCRGRSYRERDACASHACPPSIACWPDGAACRRRLPRSANATTTT